MLLMVETQGGGDESRGLEEEKKQEWPQAMFKGDGESKDQVKPWRQEEGKEKQSARKVGRKKKTEDDMIQEDTRQKKLKSKNENQT